MNGLQLVNLIKQFPGFTLGPLNLNIERDIRVIIGPTGSGKTTILNLISGFTKPDDGSILLDGADITNLPLESRTVGYLFQKPFLFPHLNVYDNVTFGQKKRNPIDDSETKKLLEDLGILHLCDRKTPGLSGGEMQKISLARMLITKPKIILMDEPLANLDDQFRKKLRLDLRHVLKKKKIPTIYVTHFEQDVYALADKLSILYNGKLLYDDTLESALAIQKPYSFPFDSDLFHAEGNYIEGTVTHCKGGITRFKCYSQLIEILGDYNVGSRVGILIRPEDIVLSKQIVKTSARNLLRVKIVSIKSVEATGTVKVYMMLEERLQLVAKITDDARLDLGIEDGDEIYIMFKAFSPQVVREE